MASLDVLIPTYQRPAALAVTLTSLIAQSFQEFRVVVSDQTPEFVVKDSNKVRAGQPGTGGAWLAGRNI